MKKYTWNALIVLAFFFLLPMKASAAVREVEVYLYQEYADCVFFVSWQNAQQPASVTITAPDGTEIAATEENSEFGRGRVDVNVGNAGSGYWRVLVEGDALGIISVNGGNRKDTSVQYNAVQSFTAEMAEDGSIRLGWDVAVEQDTVNLSVAAVQGVSNGSRTVYQDYSVSKTGTVAVSADNLPTGLYRFNIQVYDGSGQYTLTTEEPLYIRQTDAPGRLENVKAGSIDGEMYITWDPGRTSNYVVTLYDEALSVLRWEYVYENFYSITSEDDLDRIKVSVAAVDGNIWGEFDVYEVARTIPSGVISFPKEEVTKENVIPVHIECSSEATAGVYLDGKLLLENATSGDYELNLAEGMHEVVAYIEDTNGNMSTFSKSITVDRTPPAVKLNSEDVLKTASDSIVIEGSTEPNATVMINGVEQEMGSGSFMVKLALEKGVNPVTVSAYDVAGNKSVKTITVERMGSIAGNWTNFILPGVLFLVLAGWYGRLNKKPKEGLSE
ncbi:MAG: hypothetical protein HFH88_09965 [Lachnospiraceae bacterium]|nr:hypothetical protein [Lachnospiraceae bacterium]